MLGKILSLVAVLIVVIAGGVIYIHHSPKGKRMCMNSCMAISGCEVSTIKNGAQQMDVSCLGHEADCRSYCDTDSGIATVTSNPGYGRFKEVKNHTPTPMPASSRPAYGALAYDSASGAWGMAEPQTDAEAAKASAMKFCARFGPACKIVDTFYNTCVAVATGQHSTISWSKDSNLQKAKDQAVVNCFKQSKSMCPVKLTNCYLQ
jgi:hypothetical protein